jgi:hypothetical protein
MNLDRAISVASVLTSKTGKETPMSNKQKALTAVTIAMAAALGIVVNASAATKKKLSYEQAWAHCKALLDQERQPGDMSSGHHRYFRGTACMHKYGYRI